nr:cupin domain-containing protein [Aquibacillus albus]
MEQTYLLKDDGRIPNSELPLIIYPKVLENPRSCTAIFQLNNWKNNWTGGVFSYHHFHSNSHEVLGVVSGNAMIMFGGEHGLNLRVSAGDVVVIPAGVGHKHIKSSEDFLVAGGYPDGMDYDMRTGDPKEHDNVTENIANVPMPKLDPIFGENGPLQDIWGSVD